LRKFGFENFVGQRDVTGWSRWRHRGLSKVCKWRFNLLVFSFEMDYRQKSPSSEALTGHLASVVGMLWSKTIFLGNS